MIAGRLSAGDPIKLVPPKSLSEMKIEKPEVVIHIGADKTFSFNKEIMDHESLLKEIEAFQQIHGDANYRLKIDEDFPGNDLLLLLGEMKQRGIDKAYILTLRKGGS
ncbi:MAG: biopolymer transporter ExbD, partial [Sneathiella sp.]|nr:biopolymer transporter ExbD [Sneathiella sp.]